MLLDPTANFIEAIKSECREHGDKIAKDYFDGDMADVMGEVFGDILVEGLLCGIGNSLWDVPMEVKHS